MHQLLLAFAAFDLPAAIGVLSISLPATAAIVKWKIHGSKVDIREYTDFKIEIFGKLAEIKTAIDGLHKKS